MTETYNQVDIAEKVASGLARLSTAVPISLIAILDSRVRKGSANAEENDLLVIYEGARRADATVLAKEALDISTLEPRVYSVEEYKQDKISLDMRIAKGIVLFQKGRTPSRSQPVRRGWRRSLRWIGNGLVAAGLLIVLLTGAYYGYSYYSLSQMEQGGETSEESAASLETIEETLWAPEAAPTEQAEALASFLAGGPQGAKAAPPKRSIGDDIPWEGITYWPLGVFPATRVLIPSIGVDSKIIETGIVFEDGEWQWERPRNAVGHLKGTADPGQVGNMVLSGHISSPQRGEGDVFRRLPDVKVGDVVIVYTEVRAFTYQVTSKKVVLPTEVSVLKPTPDESVTLITCVPDLIYSHRLIVTAKRVSPS